VILVERRTGQRTVLWSRDDRLALVPQDVNEAELGDCRVLLVGSQDVETATWAAHRARSAGARTVGDLDYCEPGVERLVEALDVVIVSSAFASSFTGEREAGRALARLADVGRASLWCVTLGADGCIARVGSHTVRVPAFRVPVVDTTGAGDLFRAGFVAAWLREPDQPEVEGLLRYANAVAALNCRALGARTAAPRPHEVDTLLRDQAL
jgi:sugar/nucleoside kinase (ribokinase family)